MEKQAECREKIRGASSFLFELVNDVLDMSKMESGKIELEEVPFDLLDLLDEVVSMIEVQAMGHGLDFIYERHEEIHRQVIGSPVHLRQILMNIAGNAVKYNRENGSIRLAYQETAFDGACGGCTVSFEEGRNTDNGRYYHSGSCRDYVPVLCEGLSKDHPGTFPYSRIRTDWISR